MWRRVVVKLRALFLRRRLEREMKEEMHAHLAHATERLKARGLSESDARAAALREFGGVDQIEESARDARGGRWLESTLADARYALRQFRRTPVSTGTMILLLALGIGANAGLFTLVHSMMTQPPPGVQRDDSLVRIRGVERSIFSSGDASYPEFLQYQRRSDLFNGVMAWTSTGPTIDVGDVEHGPIAGSATYVTDNYFDVLGVTPAVGGGLPPAALLADGTALTCVISHALWEQHFGKRADIIGKTLKVNGATVTIVGVAPPRFRGVDRHGSEHRVWLSIAARAVVESAGTNALSSYDSTMFAVVARLAPRVDVASAVPVVRTIAGNAGAAMSKPRLDRIADVAPLLVNNERARRASSEDLIGRALLGLCTLLILFITCTNVSTLLIGLATTRRREIAVRLSLGAARTRIVRQLLTESVLLAVSAGAFGLFLMWLLIRSYGARVTDVQLLLDWPVIVFTVAFAIITGIVFGISPALHATRIAVSDVLKDSAAAVASTRSWLQRGLVVTQVALTQPLLVGLGATVIIIISELRNDASTPSDRIAIIELDPYAGHATLAQRRTEMSVLAERLAAMPGVLGVVSLSDGYSVRTMQVHPADRGEGALSHESFRVRTEAIPPGFFRLMDIPVMRGRDFEASEQQREYAVVIVGNDLARRLWGAADPIGRRLIDESDSSALVVVGVVDAENAGGSDVGNELRIFVPSFSLLGGSMFYVRTQGQAERMLNTIRQVARAAAPQIPVRSAVTLATEEADERRMILRATMATAAGGLLALLLSAIGLYAVVAFAVGQRTREIGIRTALGANLRDIVNLFFLRGLRLSAIGLAIGLPLSLIALRVMSTLIGLRSVNAALLAGGIAFFVLSVAALATWIPARHAAAVDPLSAIRSE